MSVAKRVLGVFLIIVGLLALLTPLTPGSWLAIVGLQLLGLGAIFRRGETQKAGAVIMSRSAPTRVALLYYAPNRSWDFPKGHVEKGETVEEAARREVMEETGLAVELLGRLPDATYRNQRTGERIRVAMFLARAERDADLRPESAAMAVEWVPREEVRERLTYQNAKALYDKVVPLMKETVQ